MIKLILAMLLVSGCATTECPTCKVCPPEIDCFKQVLDAKTKCISELVEYKVDLYKCQRSKK